MKKVNSLFISLLFVCIAHNSIAQAIHTIGERYGGGIVFYVYDNGQHGLISAISDLKYHDVFTVQWANFDLQTGTYRFGQ